MTRTSNIVGYAADGRPLIQSGGQTVVVNQNSRRIVYQPAVSVLNSASPNNTEVGRNSGAAGRPIPIVYGEAQLAADVFVVNYADGVWTVGYVVCLGTIDGYSGVLLDGEAPDPSVNINYYDGDQSTPDPLLAAAISGYADSLEGIAYIVIEFSSEIYEDWPLVLVTVRGKKVWNPKTYTTVYSTNPALHLGDFIGSQDYGLDIYVDEPFLEIAMDAADDTTPGEKRRESFMVIDTVRPTLQWVEVLRAYASCFVYYDDLTAYVVADTTGSSVMTLTEDDVVQGSLTIRKLDSTMLPTSIRVQYTDTSEPVWRRRYTEAVTRAGAVRESRVSLPGITRYSQAYREAIERLNKLWLADLTVEFQVFAEGIALQVGDIITLTHGYGLTSKLLRVAAVPFERDPGIWQISAVEYDPAAYSDTVATEPTYTDGTLPSTAEPDAPASLTISEQTFQQKNGEYVSRLNISWPASLSLFVVGYNVKITDPLSNIVYDANTASTAIASPPLRELVLYTITVTPYTPTKLSTNTASDNFTIIGKTAIPPPPTNLSGFEAGGQVRLKWNASTDVDAKRYEIRYGTTGGSWATAEVLDQTDALTATLTDLPEGTWRFYIKTIDSVFQYSSTAATIDIAVSLDNDAFTAASLIPLSGELADMTNMHEAFEVRGDEYAVYYADDGSTWNALYPNAMNTYGELYAEHSGTFTYFSPEADLLIDQSAQFQLQNPVFDGVTPPDMELGTKPDGGSYTFTTQDSVVETARYVRARVTDTAPFYVDGREGSLRSIVVAREETGSGTSSATLPETIVLSKRFAAARSIVITPAAGSGATARIGVYDNIVLNNAGEGNVTTFDVYIFDKDGNQVANSFLWQWKGV